jgi:hypothetical protein
MKPHELEAVRMLGVYTARTFKWVHLTGKHRAAHRAHLMSELYTVPTPQVKSGINALREKFYKLSQVSGNCRAEQDDNFIVWCKQIESEQGWADDKCYGRKTD